MVLGHGEYCCEGHLCGNCETIKEHRATLQRLLTLAELGEGCPDCHRLGIAIEEALARGGGGTRTK